MAVCKVRFFLLSSRETAVLIRFAIGPFTTGLKIEGRDTGEGFKLSQIEANPSGFFADVHSSLAVPGAVRGQFPGNA